MRAGQYSQNFNRIEIEICTGCNLRCLQCDRSSAQAPSKELMTTGQIQSFVDESVRNNWLWYEIEVLGGEPTLHPDLLPILELLTEYCTFNRDCRIILVTNGHGEKVCEVLTRVPEDVRIENTQKNEPNQIPFNDFNVAPIDFGGFAGDRYDRGCKIISECGIGMTRYGYYPCGAGAGIDRVFGFDVGVNQLAGLSDERLLEQRKLLCRYCGHYKGMNTEVRRETEMSNSWVDAYRNYKRHRPSLKPYDGEP